MTVTTYRRRFVATAFYCLLVIGPAVAQVGPTNGGTGGGGAGGSVTAAGANGSLAQAVQGIANGVPLAISGTISATTSGTYNATAPTLTNGQTTPLQTDVNGNLKTAVQGTVPVSGAFYQATQPVSGTVTANQGGAPWADNLTQVAGTALGAPTAYGTTPSGNVIGVNANVLASALPAGAATSALQTTGNGSLATIATNTTGAATAANQTSVESAAGTAPSQSIGVQSATGTPLATSALQTAGNSSLSTIASNTTGASTSANQARNATYSEFFNSALAASATGVGTVRSAIAPAIFSKYNVVVLASQSGTFAIQGCTDSACANAIYVYSAAYTANAVVTQTIPIVFPYYRVYFTNGTTAGVLYAQDSFTAG